jgi:hypothetical protein
VNAQGRKQMADVEHLLVHEENLMRQLKSDSACTVS